MGMGAFFSHPIELTRPTKGLQGFSVAFRAQWLHAVFVHPMPGLRCACSGLHGYTAISQEVVLPACPGSGDDNAKGFCGRFYWFVLTGSIRPAATFRRCAVYP